MLDLIGDSLGGKEKRASFICMLCRYLVNHAWLLNAYAWCIRLPVKALELTRRAGLEVVKEINIAFSCCLTLNGTYYHYKIQSMGYQR